MGPEDLSRMLSSLDLTFNDPNLLLGAHDDAGVYRLTDDVAIVQTVDFFTPIVDDPYLFGQIAAANALSDVYAMGGRPITALNLVAFSFEVSSEEVLQEILRGGADKVREAGAVLLGGHTIDEEVPKYGLAVTGVVHPGVFWRKEGARPGDRLLITKPIGTGVISKAIKDGIAEEAVAQRAAESMAKLNRIAAETAGAVGGVHAATDVTGFGLLSHLHEITKESGVRARLESAAVPLLPGCLELVARDVVPGGSRDNLAHARKFTMFAAGVSPNVQQILADAVTAGGLLLAVDPRHASSMLAAFLDRGLVAADIGAIESSGDGAIEVI